MPKLTRRRLLCATAPLAAAPLGAKLVLDDEAEAAGHDHAAHRSTASHEGSAAMGHAAMIGDGAPAVGGPNDLDALLYPPPALPHGPGRVREYTLVARDRGDRDRPGGLLPRLDVQRHRPRPRDPRHRGRHAPRQVRERRRASAHDPLPRHPPDGHGRRLRDRRPRRATSRTSSRRGRPAFHALPLPRDAAQEAHPQGPLRRLHHRPEGAARAGPASS